MALKKNRNGKMLQCGSGLTVDAGCVMVHRNGARLSIRRWLEYGFGFRIRSGLLSAKDKCSVLFPAFQAVSASVGAFSSLLQREYPHLTSVGKPGCSNKTGEQSKMD